MKKNNIILIVILFLSVSIMSCKKDTKDVSKVTTYAVLTMIGPSDTVIATGSTWVDPGVTVSTGDPYTVTPATFSTATAGKIELSYKAVNSDGFPSIATRVIWIVGVTGDGSTNYAGAYEGGRGTSYSNEMGDGTVYLRVTDIAGVYFCTDMFARYYEVWKGYGIAYHCSGVIRVNADKSIDNANVNFVSPWGACFMTTGTGSVNTAGKFTYKLTLGGSAVAAAFFLEPKP